jgi:flagellar biosynthesis protein FliQ
MTGADVLDIARDTVWVFLKLGAPLMLVALGVGLVISLFQALTQIQEQTLIFVPKMILAMPFFGDVLSSYMARVAARIVSGG